MELVDKPDFRVLHIGNEKSWRGGENQIRLLAEGLLKKNVQSYMAYPVGSRGIERYRKAFPALGLHSARPGFRVASQIASYCEENSIDIIDAHSSGAHSMALSVKKSLPQIKLVVHRRVDNPIKTNFFSKRKYKSPLINRYVPISNFIGQMLVDYGIPEDKITSVRSCTDSGPFDSLNRLDCQTKIKKQLGVPKDTLLIGNASAFTEQKGYDTFIRAIHALGDIGVPYHCAFAGDGHLLGEMRQLARTLRVENRITFMGFINHVPEFLKALDILVVPSNWEGLGTLILDGIHAGCAVTASRVGGIPEMIHHDETGLLADKGDFETQAKNMARYLKDSDLREKLSSQAKSYIDDNFSLGSMVEGNYKVYKELLNT